MNLYLAGIGAFCAAVAIAALFTSVTGGFCTVDSPHGPKLASVILISGCP